MKEYLYEEIKEVEELLKAMLKEHSEDNLNVLKQTLKEIRNKVDESISCCTKLENENSLTTYKTEEVMSQIKQAFPQFIWEVEIQLFWGWVAYKGVFNNLIEVRLTYRVEHSGWVASVEFGTTEKSFWACEDIERTECLEDCLKLVKSNLLPLQKTWSQLKLDDQYQEKLD